jgi:hypothetical protein
LNSSFVNIFSDFRIIFLSIVIEAFPFLLIGAFLASIIELFVTDEVIQKFLPKSKILQMISASFLGLIFPICECAIIPVARKLIDKGIPVGVAMVFMFSVPIINPVSMLATYFAFLRTPGVLIYRICCGFAVAMITGIMLVKHKKEDALIEHDSHDPHDCHEHHHHGSEEIRLSGKLVSVINTTRDEFFSVGFYLILGAMISSAIQVLLPETFISKVGEYEILSILSLQGLGYALSLCSHADAFVAAGLLGKFSFYSVLAFLITSPLMDVKNTIVLFGLFKKRFSVLLIIRVLVVTFVIVYLLSRIGV